ncbi:hypothetical protein ANCDUO_08147 [Ancylostoma duodenale]|uniref:BEACH domain-containing protein n=1 Tax=Ancylostoma duodenale TaxID=51022 RepID=A0A0C2CX58_9BILA|nr:hypothetical protein ANCDUO_08147 [Ancylostoma duodenale]
MELLISKKAKVNQGTHQYIEAMFGIRNEENAAVENIDVFEFYPRCEPISVEIMGDAITTVKFELRILNKLIEPLPTFENGDLTIRFDDGSSIKIYPTLRPIYSNIRDFAKAAIAFQATPLIYLLSKHLVEFNTRAMSLEQKLRAALDFELCPAIEELVYRAAQDGVWSHLIKLGFEPETFFGPEVYKKVVCPAIVAGRQNEYGTPLIPSPYQQPDFFSEESANDKNNVSLLFRSTPFYVNRGILDVHGTSKFTVNKDGSLLALFTREMEEQCAKSVILPGEVLVSLFCSLYPLGPAVPIKFLRAAIVFCHDHDWHHTKSKLEQDLMQEPPDSTDTYRDQIIFAESFNLQNMLTVCIQRAEGSCNTFANELIKRDDFKLISAPTRDFILDRVCSGWGLEPKHVNRLATREPTSFRERQVGLVRGGPRAFEEERKAGTLAEMVSEYYFGPKKIKDYEKQFLRSKLYTSSKEYRQGLCTETPVAGF